MLFNRKFFSNIINHYLINTPSSVQSFFQTSHLEKMFTRNTDGRAKKVGVKLFIEKTNTSFATSCIQTNNVDQIFQIRWGRPECRPLPVRGVFHSVECKTYSERQRKAFAEGGQNAIFFISFSLFPRKSSVVRLKQYFVHVFGTRNHDARLPS